MNLSRIIISLTSLVVLATSAYSQKSLEYVLPDNNYKSGMELFEKQKYAVAQEFFRKVIDNPQSANTEARANAMFYAGICALELFNPNAEYLLLSFVSQNPHNYKVNEAYFYLGRYYYNNKKFDKAVEYFEKINMEALTEEMKFEYRFEAGYCYFMTQNLDKARMQFYEIKGSDNKFASPAIYYYSHIAYQQKNYETAQEGFLKLREDETFAPIVPYYITQIYFLQKKFEKVTEYAPPLLDSVVEKRAGEMCRMVAESYYRQGKVKESLPYYKRFADKTPNMTAEDRYQMAYAFYKSGDYATALKYFEPIASGNSALAQNASYHLADCYLRTNNKTKARLAFSAAAATDFNADIKENALFNYAVATYEQSMSAFNEAVKAFEEFIKLYPYSNRADDAYNYLVLAYTNTKNYKAAVESIDKIKRKDNTIRRALQRVAFFRGLELYNSLKFEDAILMFDRSLECAQFDASIAARANYWKAESEYRQGNYTEALKLYNKFLTAAGAASSPEFEPAHYNLAYCYFNQKNYDQALDWFRRYTALTKDAKTKTTADTYNRIGDCDFMKSSYWQAIENYEKAMTLGVQDADYSQFQKAFALGLVNRQEKKVTYLDQLMADYPNSSYTDDALYEKGRALVVLNNNQPAIASFKKLLTDFPSSSYIPKALLQLGLVYFNMDKNPQAIENYKQVIEKFPGTPDSRNALNGLKAVYVDMNDVDAFFAYVEKSGEKSNLRTTEQDSLSYTSAENIYMTGDCDKSSQQFARYLERFTEGTFLLNANYYLADCHFRNNRFDEALKGFEYVLAKPRSMFTEQALVNAVSIRFSRNEYAVAIELYKRLIAEAEQAGNIFDGKIGQMRCAYKLADYTQTITAAKAVLASGKVPAEVAREAHYVLAKSYLETIDNPNIINELKLVSKDVKSAEGAECKYLLALQYFTTGKKDLAEKEIFDFIDKNTPYQYWLGKSFLLLSDIYLDKKDEFQAAQTLQSIIDYYEKPDDGIKAEAQEKKTTLDAKNAAQQAPTQSNDVEVNMNTKKIQ